MQFGDGQWVRGDVLMTGTPWGCGEVMEPKRSLADGEVVEAGGIGLLRNPVEFIRS
jgi:2-keto-4-pentenoate hydratase/2-oxohepta-3-ene-1,7-dioic acid hydratase in catechol pathway